MNLISQLQYHHINVLDCDTFPKLQLDYSDKI